MDIDLFALELAKAIEELALERGQTVSELIKMAIKLYPKGEQA